MNTADQNRKVAYWLLAMCALVFAMVVLGGVTRLTGSGLSMTDWRPATGFLPPLNEQAWEEEFERYQQSPEFQKINSHMDVDDFKGIFWLEFLHRLLGRIIGLAFVLPFIYFLVRGYIQVREWPKYTLMFVLGGMQGVLGWYMVKSGLVDNPHVSQYRLTAHLVAAFLIYAYMFWIALTLIYPAPQNAEPHPWYRKTLALTILITVTVVSGGFVAGLKAGKIYNTFPKMGEYWVPPDLLAPTACLEKPVRQHGNGTILIIVSWLWAHIYSDRHFLAAHRSAGAGPADKERRKRIAAHGSAAGCARHQHPVAGCANVPCGDASGGSHAAGLRLHCICVTA